MQLRTCWFLLSLCTGLYSAEIIVDLRNPTYKNGVVVTKEGGIIQGENLRIQAKTIEYTHTKIIHRIEAEGDLMIQYKGRAFVGSRIEYDFLNLSGAIYDGKTFQSGLWFIGGEKILLKPDGGFEVDNATITTSENKESSWDLFATHVDQLSSDLFMAKQVTFRLFKTPTFWLPSLKLNLKKSDEDPILRYFLNWDKSQGVRVGMRYQLYSWRDFSLFGRVEYRWRTGFSGAVETEYFPEDSNVTFVTRSYAGTDRLETAPNQQFRFRLQGAHHWKNESKTTETALLWDKYSDVRMPSDFASDDFEVETAKQTLFWLHHQEPFAIFDFKTRPRVNTFESIKQDLPTFYLSLLPLNIGSTGIVSSFLGKASYVDFAYSDQLASSPPLVPPTDYRSGRFEAREKLYRPFGLGPITFTPNLGAIGIFYTNSASSQTKALGLLSYGADLVAKAERLFGKTRHVIEPYVNFSSLTHPTILPDNHYIFSIADGFNQIHQIHAGIRNQFISNPCKGPWLTTDLYANAFFSDSVIPQFVQRLYLLCECKLPSVYLSSHNAWNFQNQVLDFSNTKCKFTINENIAMSFEVRYRSPYDWRKADHENFILDVTREESDLIASPLSDQRMTLLADLFIRFSPFWECHIQSHQGYLRTTETPYGEFKIDFITWIASSFKLRLSYSHLDKDDRFTWQLYLIKKK